MEKKDYLLKQYMVEENDIKKFIRSYWILKKSGEDKKIPKLFPIPSAHIIISLEDDCSFESKGERREIDGDMVFHPTTHMWSIYYGRNTHIIGIELSPQGYYYLSGEDVSKKVDKIEPLRGALPKLWRFIQREKEVLKENRLEGLKEYLRKEFQKYFEDEDACIIDEVIGYIDREQILIREVAERLGFSARTLERKFKRNTGLTLKKYQTILRLNALLEDIYMTEEINWGELAVKHGFFDQAHMIKMLKEYLGMAPGEYLEVRDLLGDIFEVE